MSSSSTFDKLASYLSAKDAEIAVVESKMNDIKETKRKMIEAFDAYADPKLHQFELDIANIRDPELYQANVMLKALREGKYVIFPGEPQWLLDAVEDEDVSFDPEKLKWDDEDVKAFVSLCTKIQAEATTADVRVDAGGDKKGYKGRDTEVKVEENWKEWAEVTFKDDVNVDVTKCVFLDTLDVDWDEVWEREAEDAEDLEEHDEGGMSAKLMYTGVIYSPLVDAAEPNAKRAKTSDK